MAEARERILVAATVEPVEVGQRFEDVPPHMTVIGWLMMYSDLDFLRINMATRNIFRQDYFQDVEVGKKVMYGADNDIPALGLKRAEKAPWYGLHSLATGLKLFPDNDQFIDVFSPHISETDAFHAKRGQRIALPTIAIFARQNGLGTPRTKEVRAVFPLGSHRPDESAA